MSTTLISFAARNQNVSCKHKIDRNSENEKNQQRKLPYFWREMINILFVSIFTYSMSSQALHAHMQVILLFYFD